MTWFTLWLPLALQVAVPVLLVASIAGARARATRLMATALTLLYLVAIALAGLWLVLPWWLPFVYAALALAAARRSARRAPASPRVAVGGSRARMAVSGAAAAVLSAVIVLVLAARHPPDGVVALDFPLGPGTYLVVNGGNHSLINAHLGTLEGERFRPYRGQSYGVDLVGLDRAGFRTRGLLPADPRAYVIYGAPVAAPCAGRVVRAVDGAPDMSPPQPDRSQMAGNHVLLECAGVWVLLGHLAPGSVMVETAQTVARGQPLGRVGNSGNTGEPHLHIHAQSPGSEAEPLSGDPLPVRLDGRYLVRNARVTVPAATRGQ